MLSQKNCIDEDSEGILMERFEKKLMKNEIEIEYLNQTLR
jgi:hypothetical protein